MDVSVPHNFRRLESYDVQTIYAIHLEFPEVTPMAHPSLLAAPRWPYSPCCHVINLTYATSKIRLTGFAGLLAFQPQTIPRSPKTYQPNLLPSGVAYESICSESDHIKSQGDSKYRLEAFFCIPLPTGE